MEGSTVMAKERVLPEQNFKILGSFKSSKHLPTIQLEDDYFVKCVHVGSGGSIRVGMVFSELKKKILKSIVGESSEDLEASQVALGEENGLVIPEDMQGIVKKITYSEGSLNCPDRFFDELHVYLDFKHSHSCFYGVTLGCCASGYLLLEGGAMRCSSCGKVFSISSWVKPKASINF